MKCDNSNTALRRHLRVIGLAILLFALAPARAELVINEILFNPPGTDSSNEYIELRGTPNLPIPSGTYLITVEGDAAANPGTIQNAFDLSAQSIGGNGFLVLLQKANPYSPNTNTLVLANTAAGPGWGSGSTSSVGHRGNNGLTELKNPSVTFLLVQSTNAPVPGDDIDANNDAIPDSATSAAWTVLDSIGVLDADGLGDLTYGAISFRRDTPPGNGAKASGLIVPVGFTPRYLGRAGNTSGSIAADWIASDSLGGSAPTWSLGNTTNTVPSTFAGAQLNHLGAPNFGAPSIPGVVLAQTLGSTQISEDGLQDTFSLALNTKPAGPVTIQIDCEPQLEISTDGLLFATSGTLVLTSTLPRTITVRALDDNVVDTFPHWRHITNYLHATLDPVQYPLSSIVPNLSVAVLENDTVLLSEIKVNPPSSEDAPFEFIEIRGPPAASLTNIWLLAVNGDSGSDPGKITYAFNLTNCQLGTNGLLLVVATNHPYAIPTATTVVTDPQLNQSGGALGNGSISFFLLSTTFQFKMGQDLDKGDNGVLEGLPQGATILDSLAWRDGDKGDLVYGPELLLPAGTPDAATRWPGNNTPNSSDAWLYGNLAGPNGDSFVYDGRVSTNLPLGSLLTPGFLNATAPLISSITPVSGVIGDGSNPVINFSISDTGSPPGALSVFATSTNPAVVPNTNLLITVGPGATCTLRLDPVGVGYSEITLWVANGSLTGRVSFPYAASAPGRPGGIWHIGASDSSTAIPVDADYLLVGDDENQTLRLYARNHSGLPISRFDMTSFLALPDISSGLPREVDIEASTRVGNRLFWIGSHGHGAVGETRTNRTRIFATDLIGSGATSSLAYFGRYDYLKLDLINWDNHNLHGKGTNYYGLEASDAEGVPPKAPDGSGLSIEGLAMMPGNTNGAYIAFRAPIVTPTNRTYALIVPLLNFATLTSRGGPPGSCVFGPPIELDLYGRGIRSLEGNSNGFLIVAGPAAVSTGPYPQDFRLYTWTGNPSDQPQQRTANLSDLNPEGIVELPPGPWTPDTAVQLLSDKGTTVYYGDGDEAKQLTIPNFKKSRSDWLPIGAVTKPAPIITSVRKNAATLTIYWRALKGETYRIQSAANLALGDWTDIGGSIIATGPYQSAEVGPVGPQRFYRLYVAP